MTAHALAWRTTDGPHNNGPLWPNARESRVLKNPTHANSRFWRAISNHVHECYNIFRWYGAGWGRYTQADPLGIGGREISLFPSGERVMWTQRHFENIRSHGFNGASALTTYAYAEDTPVRAADPLGPIIWNCLTKATTGMTTHRPNDPQDARKGFKLVCVYEVECETVDLLSPYPIKIEGFWIRNMHTVRPCSCDKYCSFQVGGLPQTVMDQNLFVPLGPPFCSNLDSRNSI